MHSRSRLLAASALAVASLHVAGCGQEGNLEATQSRPQALTADQVCIDGDPACTPSGAHAKHAAYSCATCHAVAGRLSFQLTGPAYGAGQPAPTFDAVAKTCSNVACHVVPSGTFSFYFPGGDGEPALETVSFGGGAAGTTPSWYSTGGGCTGCHKNPPDAPAGGKYVWHSGYHGGQGPTGANNQCQFCHPDAYSPGTGIGTTITNPSLHKNGVVNVQATFRSSCFGCH